MRACTKASIPRAFATVLLLGAVLLALHQVMAVVITPVTLVATQSSSGLVLSFPTASPNLYTLQSSPDLIQWTNYQSGIPGDGTVKSVAMSNAPLTTTGFYRLSIQSPTNLVLPQGDAFAIVGYDCGGIKEQVFVIGFDPTYGYPLGQVYLSTTCSGSGRDPRPVTHTGAASVMWDLGGNVISYGPLSNAVAVSSNFIATDAFGDTIYNTGTSAHLVVPLPGPPMITTAAQSDDQFNVSWTLNGANPIAVTSSTLIATPISSTAAVLTTTVAQSATSGILSPLQPGTTYQIMVVNNTISGSSPPSAPVTLTTSPATIVPGVLTNIAAAWSNPDGGDLPTDTIIVNWQPADPGNSPIDEYLIAVTGSDGAGTYTQTISTPTLTAYFNVSTSPSWSVTVQAHNAAGWGPVSSVVHPPGL